ncbi:putative reverse transcriptase domain-containing protein [Tanacetum coccineum]
MQDVEFYETNLFYPKKSLGELENMKKLQFKMGDTSNSENTSYIPDGVLKVLNHHHAKKLSSLAIRRFKTMRYTNGVKTAFLKWLFDEEDIYMVRPGGFVELNTQECLQVIKKSFMVLKQASGSWNKRFDGEIKRMDNSKRGYIPMQEGLDLNKTQGASTPGEVKRMQNVPYDLAVGSIIYVIGYGGNPEAKLRVDYYCDAGFETDRDDTKSQTGYVFILNGGADVFVTWWNGNVQTLGLANANQIPWSNVKAMMTTEYCPATEIQRMEQELWTLTLKGDDIEAYNNRFHELVLMCPELVSTEKKKIEKYIRGFPEGIKGNVTSSKPATLHDAINMARELIEQGVQAKALRIGDSNKRKWEDQQGNNYHQQQNRRQEAAKVYVAAPAKGRGYAGNLPWCNRCKAHHQPGPCPPRCGKCHKLGHQEGECRTRIPVARDNSLQNVTCFGCGNHGHYRSDCPELKNRN